jgi:branched-chain amino acid transport system permease protein
MATAGPLLAIALSGEQLWWANVLVLTSVYALFALSLNLTNGHGGMFSLGLHGFAAIGGYAAAWLTVATLGSLPGPLLFLLSLGFAMVVAAVGGAVIGIPCLRLRGDYLAIATLGFGEIVRKAIENTPVHALGGSLGYHVPRAMIDPSDSRSDFRLLFVGIGAALVLLVATVLRNAVRSSRGRAMLAVAQDETAASLLGVDPARPKITAFLIGAALAGLGGALAAHFEGRVAPADFSLMLTVKVFLIVVFGGLGSISGCVLAAFVLVAAEQLLTRTGGAVAEWKEVLYALLLILLMIFRPRGILGGREVHEAVRDAWRGLRRRPA